MISQPSASSAGPSDTQGASLFGVLNVELSLVGIVDRLAGTPGEVCIGNRDIRDMPLDQLRGMIGYAAQEPVLFSRTLEHNIGFGVKDADMGLIGWAADVAHLHHDVTEFPEQYQTLLGERGVTLSGGVRVLGDDVDQEVDLSRHVRTAPSHGGRIF